MTPLTVLVAGHVTLDRYGHGLEPGGSAYYAAHSYRALGASVRVATAAGRDLDCDLALAGIKVSLRRADRTTVFANHYGPDGVRHQRVEAVAPPLGPAGLPQGWRDVDLLHLAPVMQELEIAPWRAAVRARTTGIGVQGWVRRALADGTVVQPPWAVEPGDLAGVDVACVGEDDLSGQGDLLDRLVAAIPVVAFTHGERGCDVVVRGRTARVGVYRTTEVDPTGAGDVFSAGFFLALARGADPVDAARLGAAAASIVIEGRAGETLARVGEAHARAPAIAAAPAR